jgi:phosphonoacetaldehyde hydrolase
MSSLCLSRFRGPVSAVIFDWAGTIVDYGSLAPVVAFRALFAGAGVPIDEATARGPMGRNKRDHIADILLRAPGVASAWASARGAAPGEADVDALYAQFTPLQVAAARARGAPVPGALAALAALRAAGVRVGSCSGYNAEILDAVVAAAAAHGLRVDAAEPANAAGSNGRPKPWLSTRVAEALDAYPLAAVVKVDDTLPGIAEGLHAGMWTVGVTRTGNELGLDLADADALPAAELARRLAAAAQRFRAAGAHFVVESVAEVPAVVEEINKRMARGESPLHYS